MSHKQVMFRHKFNSYKTFTVYPAWGANDTQPKDTKHKGLEGEGATNKLCLDTSATHIRLLQFTQSGERTKLSIKTLSVRS
jgi:hypothetical protein